MDSSVRAVAARATPLVAGLRAAVLAAVAFTLHAGTASAQAQVGLSPASIAFGGQSMGTSSPPAALTITNTGNATLTVSGITANNAQFSVSGTCGSIAPGASCQVGVRFAPAVVAGALHFT